ncbi:MAG: DUF2811 domain-containing protein [Stenomitos rutilans HA7619-LM2]|jgi:hypothetical protein|nr:DUF2811 domain-containing protein [Stenomitos rutilans HA7619-LM2]MBW4469347.1 DUF2811 domain-containing protein [Stenomitos rutilans HA7619-LM2]
MTVSLLIEVPEHLHDSLRAFLALRPGYDTDRVFAAALALFLLQNRTGDVGESRAAARVYLDALFKRSAGGEA